MLERAQAPVFGHPRPRIGPPAPLRHDLAGYRASAASLGIDPMPWQDTAACYLTALDADDLWLYREIAVLVGRQNGKTTLIKPVIVPRLLAGRRILLIAQVRELPRIMFEGIADVIEETHPDLLPRRRGKVIWARRGAGSESIVLTNGGTLRIAAATTGAARGMDRIDDLFIDELREMDSFDVINAAKPTQRFSDNPQTVYLSNEGDDDAVILNWLQDRAGKDPSLAYLGWSSDPDLDAGDMLAWLQSNPAIGHYPQVLRDLERDYRAAVIAGNMAGFETEALCRRVPTMRPRLVDEFAWARCHALKLDTPRRPSIGLSYDPAGRASVVMAWRQEDGTVALRELFDVAVDETGILELGTDAMKAAMKYGAQSIGYDDATDRDLARQFTGSLAKKVKPVIAKDFANASEAFVRGVEAGSLRWHDGEHITSDLKSTSRKDNDEAGTFHAVKSKDDVPITASLAAIRAVWLASGPKAGKARIY